MIRRPPFFVSLLCLPLFRQHLAKDDCWADDGWMRSSGPRGCSLSQVSTTLEFCLGDISLGAGVALLRAMGQVDPEGNRPGFQRRKLSLAGRWMSMSLHSIDAISVVQAEPVTQASCI